MPNIKRRFEVHPYDGPDVDEDGKVSRIHYKWDEKARKFKEVTVKEDAGFMVYTPNGTSTRIRTKEELQRLGYDREPELVDMDSGETMGPADTSLKTHSERVAHRSKPKTFQAALATKE